jgi:hypothetical protein
MWRNVSQDGLPEIFAHSWKSAIRCGSSVMMVLTSVSRYWSVSFFDTLLRNERMVPKKVVP